jgi:hypothetical protein
MQYSLGTIIGAVVAVAAVATAGWPSLVEFGTYALTSVSGTLQELPEDQVGLLYPFSPTLSLLCPRAALSLDSFLVCLCNGGENRGEPCSSSHHIHHTHAPTFLDRRCSC